MSTSAFLSAITARRTIYALGSKSTLSNEELIKYVLNLFEVPYFGTDVGAIEAGTNLIPFHVFHPLHQIDPGSHSPEP